MEQQFYPHQTRNNQREEQQIYDHFIDCIQVEDSHQILKRFRLLFIEGSGYPDPKITQALDRILVAKVTEEDFNFILNRCCYILINRWHASPHRKQSIYKLNQIFDNLIQNSPSGYLASRRSRDLFQRVQKFIQSEHYSTLKRFTEIVCQPARLNYHPPQSQPLRTLIPRYPYLYPHCLLSENSSYEHQQMIRKIKAQKQQKFELDLSQYVAHQWRRVQAAKISLEAAKKIKLPVHNPTLLSNRELFFAIRQFIGKVEGSNSYRDLAHRFKTQIDTTQSFRSFKDSFYEYLTSSPFESSYAKRQFNDKLHEQIKQTIPQSNDENFNEFLLLRTCSQMLNFLVIESSKKPNHFMFIDLISNLGPTFTVGLLLKIILICHRVRSYLEKRFALLFNHYESSSQDGVQWLVKVLENLNIALTTNFSNLDLSFIC